MMKERVEGLYVNLINQAGSRRPQIITTAKEYLVVAKKQRTSSRE